MQQYTDNKGNLITDTYIRLDYVRALEELYSVFNHDPVQTDIEDVNGFVRDLEEQEEESPRNKNTAVIYGVVLSFLMDQNSKEDPAVVSKLIDKILEHYPGLPHYCYTTRKGKAFFINVYLCEREYRPDGVVTQILATKDIYRNKKTGKACTKDDADAFLYKKTGEVLRTITAKFSSKKDYFRYATEKQFLYAMDKLKAWYMDIYEKVTETIIKAGISFKKFILNKTRNKANAKVFNKALADMENMFIRRFTALEVLSDRLDGGIDPRKKGELEKIYKEVDAKVRGAGTFTYKDRVTFSLDLTAPRKQAKETAEMLKDYFAERLLTVSYE